MLILVGEIIGAVYPTAGGVYYVAFRTHYR